MHEDLLLREVLLLEPFDKTQKKRGLHGRKPDKTGHEVAQARGLFGRNLRSWSQTLSKRKQRRNEQVVLMLSIQKGIEL